MMNKYRKYFHLLGLVLFVLSPFAGCEEDDSLDGNDNNDSEPKVQVVNNSEFGKVLVNQENQSLYFFAGDVTGESNCNGGCADKWPPLLGELYELEFGSGLNEADFSTINRQDGQKQITYKGWPLYYFSPESDGVLEAKGETSGDGLGGVFHIAKPDYTVLVGRQAVTEDQDAIVYLVDDRGVSLYRNTGDEENISNCNGGCAGVWPPLKEAALVIPSSLSIYDFDSIDREDDLGPQLSFKGSPIYFFSQDEQNQGSVLGQAGGPNKTFFVIEQQEQ